MTPPTTPPGCTKLKSPQGLFVLTAHPPSDHIIWCLVVLHQKIRETTHPAGEMFLSRFTAKSLRDPNQRQRAVQNAVAECRALYTKVPVEQAREPLLKLQDLFDQEGIDRLELLYSAETTFPQDPFWLTSIVEILMRKSTLARGETAVLLKEVRRNPTLVDLWHRIFRERRDDPDQGPYQDARRLCALALLPYFDPNGTQAWPDSVTREDARKLFHRCLDDTLEQILAKNSRDSDSLLLLEMGMEIDEVRPGIQLHLAEIYMERNDRDPLKVGLVLTAALENPGRRDLRIWAARALLDLPGQQENGLGILRQLYQENSEDPTTKEHLVSAIKEMERIDDEDEEVLSLWIANHPGDQRALELLADFCAEHQRLDEFALSVYRRAAAHGPNRRLYLRMMGRSHAARAEWQQVIQIFDEVRDAGEDVEDLVIPLATAYSEFERCDKEAESFYERAVAQGSLSRKIHDLLCKCLYESRGDRPESVTQFSQTLDAIPGCTWARIGMAAHYLRTMDPGRALEQAVAVLEEEPDHEEACKLAARAISINFSRNQLSRLVNLRGESLSRIYAEAYRQNPDAGPIAMAHARRRLADGLRDEETSRLLGEVCRRNPEALDMRIARADLMWDLDEKENAVSLYRELHERWSGVSTVTSTRNASPATRRHILFRLARWILDSGNVSGVDVPILIEAASEEESPEELLLAAAHHLVQLGIEHPRKWFFVEQALRIAPEDALLERAMAEGMALRGKPALALKLIQRSIENGRGEEDTAELLRTVKAFCRPPLPGQPLAHLHRIISRQPDLSPRVLLAAMELFLHEGRRCNKADRPILEKLLEAFPKNVRVKHWMAQCLSDAGESENAAALLSELIDDAPGNDEAVLELARTHARLGSRDRENYRVARAAVAIEPEDIELRFHLASIEMSMGNYKNAARHLEEILQEAPDYHPRVLGLLQGPLSEEDASSDLLIIMARAHLVARKEEHALAVLSRLRNKYQHHFSAMMDLYGDILTESPDNLRARLGRAVLLRLAGRVEEASSDLRKAHKQSPDNLDILAEYAAVLNQKINSTSEPEPELCIQVAEMQLRLGDEDAAYELARKVIKVNPDHDPSLKLMARLHLLDGALQLCWSTLQALTDRGSVLPLYQQLASAFAEQGDHLKAAEVLTDALEIGGPQRELLEQLRSLHQRQAESSKGMVERQAILGSLSDRAQGRYELREEIGSGSMGVVYKAHDRELDEIVVLKILPEHFANNEKALMRFRHEAKAARKLAHPNIVRIHDFGEEGGRKHISMEYVSGGDLKEFFRRAQGNIGVHRAIQIMRQVAHALAHAHAEGILHRDIKAANILLTASGKAKLSDFGISALIEEVNKEYATPHSSQGILGTPLYMAPEQFRAESLTQATDLYAMGVLFYELLSGKPPFTRGSISYHQQFTPPRPIEGIPTDLWEIVDRLLRKNPAERFQCAEDLIEALNLFAETGWSPII